MFTATNIVLVRITCSETVNGKHHPEIGFKITEKKDMTCIKY